MTNYYTYLPVSEEDERWGLTVLDTGYMHIAPGYTYPQGEHSAPNRFNWGQGRVLQEYQVIYITRGGGVFESDNVIRRTVTGGSIILVFPGERHRYKPNKNTGWDEYWVSFAGSHMDHLVKQSFFDVRYPIWQIGVHNSLVDLFHQVIDHARTEKTGYQPHIAGTVMHLLGHVYALLRQQRYAGSDVEELISKARALFRSNADRTISPVDVAKELQISYARFRKIFKEYTGLAPGQFQIQLKIQQAKELLLDPAKSIKQVAYELAFESNFYFSKLFKEKTGMTPLQYRNKAVAGL